MSDLMPSPDDFVGAYRIVRPIGKGGMGVVFEAVHTRTGKPAAIKVLHARFTEDTEALSRFLAEGRATAKLDHPSIVRILETGQLPSGACYIAMEYLRGETLGARLKRQGRLGRDALRFGAQIAAALVQAHQKNIIHRDLKPSNLILLAGDEDGTGRDQVKIIDFGIAKIAGDDKESGDFRTRTGTMIGTPVYMSPEQCRGVAVTDRTDVYALGIILYQALAGRPPFYSRADGDILAMHIMVAPRPLREMEPAVPQSVADFIGRMLAKNAADRPNMATVASELSALGDDPEWATPAPAPTPAEATPAEPPAAASAESPAESLNEPLPPVLPPMSTPPSASIGPVTGQSAALPAPPTADRRRLGVLAASAGLVVAALAGGLVFRSVHRPVPPPPVHRVDTAPVAAPATIPAGIQVTSLPSNTLPSAQPVVTAEPPTVRWSVRSHPTGATVLSERGELLGQTPLVHTAPRTGATQTLIVRLPGYRDAQLSLSQSSDEEREAELVALAPGKYGKYPGKRVGKRTGQGKRTADDTTILLDFKTKKLLKTR